MEEESNPRSIDPFEPPPVSARKIRCRPIRRRAAGRAAHRQSAAEERADLGGCRGSPWPGDASHRTRTRGVGDRRGGSTRAFFLAAIGRELGPPARCSFALFLEEGSPTTIDYRYRLVPLFWLFACRMSNLGSLWKGSCAFREVSWWADRTTLLGVRVIFLSGVKPQLLRGNSAACSLSF